MQPPRKGKYDGPNDFDSTAKSSGNRNKTNCWLGGKWPVNLVLFLSDEHARDVVGAYNNPIVQTPTLDALAKSGQVFDRAYTNSPICVPARGSLATGRYPHQIHSWDNASPYTGQYSTSWGHAVRQAGGNVYTFGKLHYRNETDDTGFPIQFLPMHIHNGVGDLRGLLRERMDVLPQARRSVVEAGVGRSPYFDYDLAVTRAAVDWIRHGHQSTGEPWVIMISYASPHPPLLVPERYARRYPVDELPLPVAWREADWDMHPAVMFMRKMKGLDKGLKESQIRRALASYYGLVSFVDDQIAVVLNELDSVGMLEDCALMYTSDHGDSLGAHGLWWKSSMYEGSVGIPLIIAKPGGMIGRTSVPVSLVDIYPSIMDILEVGPGQADDERPGDSLWNIRNELNTRYVFSEYHTFGTRRAVFMVTDGIFKLVYYVGEQPQFFDLTSDPGELHNLSGSSKLADKRERLEVILRMIVDPEAIDAQARKEQGQVLQKYGGIETVREQWALHPYVTPVPR